MPADEVKSSSSPSATLAAGTYEVIRSRLISLGNELKSKLDKLNESRKEIFGSIETSLLSTNRITTQNNCIPRDIISLGNDLFLFGYNVHMGLKSEMHLEDVFSIYKFNDHEICKHSENILQSECFDEDFKNLYKYYKETKFAKFSFVSPHLFMVFNTGKSAGDIKTFKWILKDGILTYMDNRSDHELKFPPQHEFVWTKTGRDHQRSGKHPHVTIEDKLFVEAVGGDITFKVEDNTDSGMGIYAEAVTHAEQTLDDAEIHYAPVGNLIIVKIRPYKEDQFRYFIFNDKIGQVCKVDAIKDACILLPDDHGLIFSNGFYLMSGELKQFDSKLSNMKFENRIASVNGEDFLYVFYNQMLGDYILLRYNLIAKQVDSPIKCNGFSYFDNGEMLVFRREKEPTKHHVVQVWQTPFISNEFKLAQKSDSFLYKVGNKDIVRCMSECNEIAALINKEDSYEDLYFDIEKKASDTADSYFWVDKKEAFNLKEVIVQIKDAASGAIDEFEKVITLKKNAFEKVAAVTQNALEIMGKTGKTEIDNINVYVENLSALRNIRGKIISLKDVRYVDVDHIDDLENKVAQETEKLSVICIEFLLKPKALKPYVEKVAEIGSAVEKIEQVSDAKKIAKEIEKNSSQLEMLIEIVSNLQIDDSVKATKIIDSVSDIYATLNKVKAALQNRQKSLQTTEQTAKFNAQIKLLSQSIINYLDISYTPEKCDEYLTKVMVQIEELEGQFVDSDDFVFQLSEKREEIYNAFETKKLNLVEARNKRANVLMNASERILKGIQNKASTFNDISDINGYFAADLMIEKIRDIVKQLLEIDDSVKADDIQGRLKTIREDVVRQLKDRNELYADGKNIIKFGEHKFSVNVQPLELTIVRRDNDQYFHLTGTNFFEKIEDDRFIATKKVWDIEVCSEDDLVYRGEFLAFQILKDLQLKDKALIDDILSFSDKKWKDYVKKFMGTRYSESYVKGVHDHDGAKIIQRLAAINFSLGLLQFHPEVRALARLFWEVYFNTFSSEKEKELVRSRLKGFGTMHQLFSKPASQEKYIKELEKLIMDFEAKTGLFSDALCAKSARYLFYELTKVNDKECFVISCKAHEIAQGFDKHLMAKQFTDKLKDARVKLSKRPDSEFELVRDWVTGYFIANEKDEFKEYIGEASVLVFLNQVHIKSDVVETAGAVDINEMAGNHKMIINGRYHLNYISFMEKLSAHEKDILPCFMDYVEYKKKLVKTMRQNMRIDEFKPKILTSFVRNKLINSVYLPIIGDNLAKQIGVAGEQKRTDLMGLLLLVSPPGYGKTTLMEYIANRLGIIFMKINGPAIGHEVTSLDPDQAPFASAREEMKKLNLSLEMGDNVMIYLDDIQHLNPEFLQKFISLCDGQRKIEGVYKGVSKTYDLKGKKVVVVMAGNPYTESGDKFKIPDMLANRADTYNLGDIIGDKADAFKMSYLENALSSNPVLDILSARNQKDIYSIIKIAETGTREGVDFEGIYSAVEISELVSVMEKLIKVRDVILKVNQEYIYSAAQADEYRKEPPFKLQGSYRNMNRIAEKIVSVMNEKEIDDLITSHYENEAQTLTTGTEANLLKFKELMGILDPSDKKRWEEIKRTFNRNQLYQGSDTDDPVSRVVVQLSAFKEGIDYIGNILETGVAKINETENKGDGDTPNGQIDVNGVTKMSITDETMKKIEDLAKGMKVPDSMAKTVDGSDDSDYSNKSSRIEVVNKIPRVFLKIVQNQFKVMNAWLGPILKANTEQTTDIKKLEDEMQKLNAAFKGVMREKGDLDEGFFYDNSEIKTGSDDDLAYYNRGVAWHGKNDLKKALNDAKKALKLKPENEKYQQFVGYLNKKFALEVKKQGKVSIG